METILNRAVHAVMHEDDQPYVDRGVDEQVWNGVWTPVMRELQERMPVKAERDTSLENINSESHVGDRITAGLDRAIKHGLERVNISERIRKQVKSISDVVEFRTYEQVWQNIGLHIRFGLK